MLGLARFPAMIVAGLLALGGAVAVAAPVAAAPAPVREPTADVVTADALPTTQIDGVAWSQVIVGNTVFVGGRFGAARPAGAAPGVDTVPRSNFLAYTLSTGVLDTNFAPAFNGQVKVVAASPDGKRLYVGGDFTTVDGQPRSRIAAFDLTTRQLVPTFAPNVNRTVNAIAATNTTVYFGGDFTKIGDLWRIRLAAVAAVNGVITAWRPEADRVVAGMTFTPDSSKLVVAGNFEYLNVTDRATGLGALDVATGASLPWNDGIISFGPADGFTAVRTDGTAIYATSFQYGPPPGMPVHQFEGTVKLSPADGSILWMEDCHGDSYDTYPTAVAVYTVSHAHDCRNISGFADRSQAQVDAVNANDRSQRAMAFTSDPTGTLDTNKVSAYKDWGGTPSPSIIDFLPFLQPGTITGQSQAAWTVTGNGKYVVMSGEFPAVNSNPQQGLVRFTIPSRAPNKQGPRMGDTLWRPTATVGNGTRVRVSIAANWDRDDLSLSYRLIRNGDTAHPVATTAATSTNWSRPTLTLVDGSAPASSSVSYTVQAIDADGNAISSAPVVAATGAAPSAYASKVFTDGASLYWRLAEASGAKVLDAVGTADGTTSGTVGRNQAGAIVGDTDKASTFSNNNSNAQAWSPQTAIAATDAFTVETWLKTGSTAGGAIADFGNTANGSSSTVGRVLYMDAAGRIRFGVDDGTTQREISSTDAYRDNVFHHVVGTLGASGLQLYVDGTRVAQNEAITGSQSMTGYWRLGGDNLTGWAAKPTRSNLIGTFDEFAIYPTALSASQVAQHAQLGGKTVGVPNAPPTAAFTSTVKGLTVSTDGAGSADPDGSIASYSWNWGDGTAAGSGVSATHAYAAADTFTVVLSVTDDRGATATVSHDVAVTKPNELPAAAFSAQPDGLGVAVDGSASSDPDGTVADLSWNWGDGTAAGAGVTTTHTFAAAGSYPVTLTVTDNSGGTATLTRKVTVEVKSAAMVLDTFGRTSSSGWGTADKGGAWSLAGSASRFTVNGAVGRMNLAAPGAGLSAYLAAATVKDVTAEVEFGFDKALSAPVLVATDLRQVGTSSYRVKARVAVDGTVQLSTVRVINGAETALKTVTVPGLTMSTGDVLKMSASAMGTTISGSVWKLGGTEPAAAQASSVDTSAGLQGAGSTGLWTYLSSAATNAPLQIAFDNLKVTSFDQ